VACEGLVGQVAAPAGRIGGQILPEVRELEAGADPIGEHLPLGVAVAEQSQHQVPHGIGRARAVGEQLGIGREPDPRRVRAERLQQASKRRDRKLAAANRVGDRDRDGLAAASRDRVVELALPRIEPRDALRGRHRPFVGQIVGDPRPRVDGGQMPAERPGQQPRADREVLVVGGGDPPAFPVGRPEPGAAHECISSRA
jgi:hypothetical protein